MMAIVAAFKEWEHLLMSVHDEITVFSDHNNLEYFNSTKVLNRRQHRSSWAEFLQPFRFMVVYQEGSLNEKADTLSRRRDYCPEGGREPLEIPQKFFGPGQYEQVPTERLLISSGRLAKMTSLKLSTPLVEFLLVAATEDPLYQEMVKAFQDGSKNVGKSITMEDYLIFVKGR